MNEANTTFRFGHIYVEGSNSLNIVRRTPLGAFPLALHVGSLFAASNGLSPLVIESAGQMEPERSYLAIRSAGPVVLYATGAASCSIDFEVRGQGSCMYGMRTAASTLAFHLVCVSLASSLCRPASSFLRQSSSSAGVSP